MRDMDRRLREEQDLEFARTMEADRKRLEEEEAKKREEEEKAKKIEERANERIRRTTEQRVWDFYLKNILKKNLEKKCWKKLLIFK